MLTQLKNLLRPLFFSKIKDVKITDEQWKALQEQKGDFDYTKDGFIVKINGQHNPHQWLDIETVIGYQLDLMTTDEICMEIYFDKTYLRLIESTPGWYWFNDTLVKHISSIGENWERAIIHPAFATNLTLLYDKMGRALQEIPTTQNNFTVTKI